MPLFGGIFAHRWLRFVNPLGRFLSFLQFSSACAFQPTGCLPPQICRPVLPTRSWQWGLPVRARRSRARAGIWYWEAKPYLLPAKRYGFARRKVTSCCGACGRLRGILPLGGLACGRARDGQAGGSQGVAARNVFATRLSRFLGAGLWDVGRYGYLCAPSLVWPRLPGAGRAARLTLTRKTKTL